MLRSSIPFGRLFGVEVRVHISFLLLLAAAVGYSAVFMNNVGRGVGLWLALCFAVLVREVARAIAALYSGLRCALCFCFLSAASWPSRRASTGLRAPACASSPPPLRSPTSPWVFCSSASPTASSPKVSLFAQPWISFHHILRSTVWIQFLVGARQSSARRRDAHAPHPPHASRPHPRRSSAPSPPALGLNIGLAIVLMLAGFVLSNVWFIFFGGLMLLWSQLRMGPALDTVETGTILVSDVMLTEYTLLSSSDTLRGALAQTAHSLHDVFPVVRGDRLVGSISRDTLATRLQIDGDGFLQAAMNRNLSFAEPSEKLVDALRHATSFGATGILPVVEDGAMLGILTPQSLSRGVQLTRLTRPPQPERIEP